ncbi:hypothetical protein BT96DRAFT_939884 [Gymnopus androsaceus JB14]|uniref:Amino acid transporter transmembrane domain-containing protein n=1 Tax=Gymnopus androsaceus JB14 TaxID=1447944 RepID=A0A6A4HLD5_9AGAR|nr:hypothetical protein BT96DRAFT_939884 [Gymnopus androsaceus JB14]
MSTPLGIPHRRGSRSNANSHSGTPLSGTPVFRSATPIASTPDFRALRAQVISGTPPVGLTIPPPNTNIPPRTTTASPAPSGTPASAAAIPVGGPSRTGGVDTPISIPVNLDDLPDDEKARILRRHLVSKEERGREPREAADSDEAHARQDSEPFPVPYAAPGADVTHDIYKWHSNVNAQRQARRVRSATFSAPESSSVLVESDPAFQHIHEPGGFRRNYVLVHNNNSNDGASSGAGVGNGHESPMPPVVVNNFIDFLFLFGHFAGEDLEEDDDEDRDDDEFQDDLEGRPHPSSSRLQATSAPIPGVGFDDVGGDGPKPSTLKTLGRSRSRSRRRAASVSRGGNATVGQATLMLLKGFVGTGVLFLGKAFFNGGILFSALLFLFIAVVSLHSFLLLVKAKLVVPGNIGGALYGPWMRHLILFSIVISQLGFVGAYIIFVSENLQAFFSSVSGYLIVIQSLIFLPLSLIRDIVKLSTTALVADFFILLGLVYIFGSEISLVAERGIRPVALYNPRDASLFVGTAVFSFEGIGLIVPIVDAMKEPRKFEGVLTGVMAGLVVLFGGAGALAYLTFGKDVQTVVLVNLNEVNPGSRMLQVVQFLYSMAILLSVPLQLFPAIRIMENGLFTTRSGKADKKVKWMKNLFRWEREPKDLDKFVAFVGCFACVPLCYVYPAMLHYKACARTRKQKLGDIAMIVFGLAAAAFTTIQTVKLMIEPTPGAPPVGECGPPRV